MKQLAILILNWNGEQFLLTTLKDIFNQLDQTRSDVYVIDNDSNDSSVNIVKKNFPFAKMIIHEKNWGFGGGYNRAIGRLIDDYEYFFLLNNDVNIAGSTINSILSQTLKMPKQVGMISLKLLKPNLESIDSMGITLHNSGLGFNTKTGNSSIFCPCAGAAIYSTKMLKDINESTGEYFDQQFGFYCEDLDLGFRARLRGWQCQYLDDIKIIHHHSQSTIKKGSSFSIYHNQRNQIWAIIKNYPVTLFWKYLIIIIFVQLLEICYHLFQGSLITVIKAKYSACVNINFMLKKRKIIQKNRTVTPSEIDILFSKKSLYTLWSS